MKSFSSVVCTIVFCISTFAQQSKIDSLNVLINKETNTLNKLELFESLAKQQYHNNIDYYYFTNSEKEKVN